MIFVWPNSETFIKPGRINAPYHMTRMYELADYLEKNNVEIKLLDMEINGAQFIDLMDEIINGKHKIIVYYCTCENFANIVRYSNIVKEINNDIIQVVYGEVSSICPKIFATTKIDYIIMSHYDPEIALIDLYKYVNHKIVETSIRGLIKIENNELKTLNKGSFISPNEWGVPDEKYFNYDDLKKIGRMDQITLSITRGCPFNCNFCLTTAQEGNQYRKRPIKDIITFINNSKYSKFKFFSAFFTADANYVKQICKEIIKNGKSIEWSCCTRADCLQDEEMIRLMSKAGCYKISVGVESLSNESLQEINKRTSRDIILNSISLVKKYNIEYKALIMIGIPNQTKKELYDTIHNLNELGVTIRPTAYTPLFNIKEDTNISSVSNFDKWTFYNDKSNITKKELYILVNDISKYELLLEGKND